ncbi:flagellar hook capping FlgD N-terminal domain-containing protein [Neogemmobacter tilapiae]|uniref:Basal-body rod modification protein FlgD n=1 Tax=Neogemmobacter tilapiae TaxID=875041 RepID=A0A918TMX8_9RHOB|nr:flagellar hook capping FlgD N-terminal domain-containing protein [Gemmobacter tilapiae]GHC51900.1 basal-body rod modification protein FlgD [Gemmobacter tilapiae]
MEITQSLPQTRTALETKASINADFDLFLKMLTTQMKNQDPQDPMDSADFAVQLATFSGVEQQTKTNQLLTSLQGQIGMMGLSQMADWVGREARSTAPVWVDGQPVTLSPAPAQGASRAVLAVYNAQGQLVSRQDVPVSSAPIEWAPTDAAGNPLPQGQYTFKLESYQGEEKIDTKPVESYATVVEIRSGAFGTMVVMEGGAEIAASAVTALRG